MFNTILENFHIEKILTTIKKNLVYIIVTGVLVALIAGVIGNRFTYRSYTADVSFYVYSNPDNITDSGVNQSTGEISQANKLVTSYVQVLKSSVFLSVVADQIQLPGYTVEKLQRMISFRNVSDTAIFIVYVSDSDPVNALTVANAISELAPNIVPSIVKAGGFRVFDAAELPTAPSSSLGVSQIIIIGFVVGLLLAFMFFFFKGLTDTTIRRVYEVEDLFRIPVIGKVPELDVDKNNENKFENIILKDDSSFSHKEAYNNIRSNLMWSREEKKCPVYVVTSADNSEGKSVSAYNIAKSFSMIGKKVLLIDADMRDSKLRQIVPNKDRKGLADYLSGSDHKAPIVKIKDSFDAIYASEGFKNRAELLSTQKWYDLIEEMKEEYDEIVIDMTSLRLFSEALSLSRTDAYYIIVVREGLTKFVRTKLIVQRLEELSADIIGIVYNGISPKSRDYVFRNYKEN
jgi:capsular exopolysaccharide synthesis family protein